MKRTRRPARAASSLRASVIAVLAAVALAAPWPGEPGAAQAGVGDLLVSPVRVVLEGRERSAQVTLINKGNDVAVYRISLVNRRMLENGGFEEVEEPREGELLADDLIRYAPRRVTLEPNKPQTIRILMRKPGDLPAGEYRSHLMFRAVPKAGAGQSVETREDSSEGFTIRLTPIFGLTIPIIVRHGELSVDVAITETRFEASAGEGEPPILAVRLARQGGRSVYGDVKISLTGGTFEEEIIGEVRGVAVYTPNASRIVRVPLKPEFAADLKGREIRVAFEESGRPGKAVVAERLLSVN